MELFTCLTKSVVSSNKLEYSPYCKVNGITSLLFVDDLMLFTKPTAKSINGVLDVLLDFKLKTGLSINRNK